MMYTEIMKSNRAFQLCYRKGRSFASRYIIVYARPNQLPFNRLGITTGKKIGNAVCRSRSRRLIRQAWRENELAAPIGLDIVIVARTGLADATSQQLSEYLQLYGIPLLHRIYAGENPCPRQKTAAPQKK